MSLNSTTTAPDFGELALVIDNYIVSWDQGTMFDISWIGGHGSKHIKIRNVGNTTANCH